MAQLSWWPLSSVCLLASLAGCDVFDAKLERRILDGGESAGPRDCDQHPDCADRGEGFACTLDGRCVPLASEHCEPVAGELGTNAIVLGSLFSLTGAQAQTNLPRAQSASLAIEEINSVGGVPGTGSTKRPLVLVQCDEVADLAAAAKHLIDELNVP
ncbi:MAG TPA: hypothetical protein VFX59_04965, partial [Polyangiales bacterium]|nr:hypothetical protein [Polyangiales bacterium]